MILSKIAGTGLVIFGGAIVIFFPYSTALQHGNMTMAGIVLGLFLIALGLFLIKL